MRIRRALTTGVMAASIAVPATAALGSQAQAATTCTGPRVSNVTDGTADSVRSWTKVQLDFCGGAQKAGDVVTITIPAGSPLTFNKGTYDIVGQDKVTVIGKLVSTGTTATITFGKDVDERG